MWCNAFVWQQIESSSEQKWQLLLQGWAACCQALRAVMPRLCSCIVLATLLFAEAEMTH